LLGIGVFTADETLLAVGLVAGDFFGKGCGILLEFSFSFFAAESDFFGVFDDDGGVTGFATDGAEFIDGVGGGDTGAEEEGGD